MNRIIKQPIHKNKAKKPRNRHRTRAYRSCSKLLPTLSSPTTARLTVKQQIYKQASTSLERQNRKLARDQENQGELKMEKWRYNRMILTSKLP